MVDCHKINAMQIKHNYLQKYFSMIKKTFNEEIMELNHLINVFEHSLDNADDLHPTDTDF